MAESYQEAHKQHSPLLSVQGVTLQYRTTDQLLTATYRVSLDVKRSDRFVVLGPSGCGKSTLLKAIGGFHAPTEGRILLNGTAVHAPGPERAFVFQEFDQLLPWKTVRANIEFALIAGAHLARGEATDRAAHYIAKVGLHAFADNYPHTLSGGMKQRVAIARALVNRPSILLADEPTGNLDSQTSEEIMRVFEELAAQGQTVVMVTHEPDIAVHAKRIIVLRDGIISSDETRAQYALKVSSERVH